MFKVGSIKKPYLLFLGDVSLAEEAKTSLGIAQWRPEWCVGQLRLNGCVADAGLPDLTVEEAIQRGAKTLIVGVAPSGKTIEDAWLTTIAAALRSGLDVAAGLHVQLNHISALQQAAIHSGASIFDIRYSKQEFSSAVPRRRTGNRLLTVGTDCAVGKKYTALAIHQEMRDRGIDASFRATGQTGMFIAESGVAIDSVTADFIAGAAEWLSPDASEDHWDVVEGQGALRHPAFAGVTLGLIHGTQPDYIVMCHKAQNSRLMAWPDVEIPPIDEYIKLYIEAARLTNPDVQLLGMSFNTSEMDGDQREKFLFSAQEEFGVPCVDPIATGVAPLVKLLQQNISNKERHAISST
ncbi:DUF1611 domain-containing protein [Agrobacterium tumefaciens]|uniref:DUF1611 domain-containing protein n=1 Tax=Agrobacterium tumefaciens TaxID=358 RepID=UPI001CBC92BD|nr:DUF1611 domain-containing protein [Agrobacterium tumefaciens]